MILSPNSGAAGIAAGCHHYPNGYRTRGLAFVDSVVVFVVSLLIGGLGIHVGASVVAGSRDYSHAVVTAALGALVWSAVGGLVGGIPLIGPVLTLLAYLLVIRFRYRVGWVSAGGVAVVAWLAVLVVLYGLATVGVTTFEAVNVPGVPGV